jgi:MerR family transcriptional regulator, light-induced transcriptional regulator
MAQPGSGQAVPIATVSKLLDIPVPTIRSWERRYGFPTPSRTHGRHRRYTAREIDQLRDLRDLITRGHSAGDAVARLSEAGRSDVEDDPTDAMLREAMRLDSDGIRSALDASAGRIGIEFVVRDVVFPVMHEIGRRWKTGACDVEQEHLATESVRAWLARQRAMAPAAFRADPIVLACGPKDLHSIGIEAFALVLTRRGWSCRVLGPMTPIGALVGAVRSIEAVAAVVTAQRRVTRRAAVDALAAVQALPGVSGFYAGDAFAAADARRDVPGSYLGEDILAGAEVLESAIPTPRRR